MEVRCKVVCRGSRKRRHAKAQPCMCDVTCFANWMFGMESAETSDDVCFVVEISRCSWDCDLSSTPVTSLN